MEERVLWNPDFADNCTRCEKTRLWPSDLSAVAKQLSQGDQLARLTDGLSKATPECQAIAKRIIDTYAKGIEPSDLDPLGDAAALYLVTVPDLVRNLASRGGLDYLIKVAVACREITLVMYGVGGSYFEKRKTDAGMYSPHFLVGDFLRGVDPKEADVENARAEAERARSDAALDVRIALAVAFNAQDWAAEDAREFLTKKKNEIHYTLPRSLLEVLRDPELLLQVAKRYPSDVPAYDLVHTGNLEFAPAVIARFDKDPNNEYAANALAMIESMSAAKAMVSALGKKRTHAIAKAYFERRPDLAEAVLGPIVEQQGKAAPFAKPILESLGARSEEERRGGGDRFR